MATIIRTDSNHPHFIELVKQLDAFLADKNGEDHSFYDQYNKIDNIKYAVVVYEDATPVACGAIKEYAPGVMEVKRMYTIPEARGKGIAAEVLRELEVWAHALGYATCILETLKTNEQAVRLYTKSGYTIFPNYGQYEGMDKSVCFEKALR